MHTILLIDDEPDMADLFKQYFRQEIQQKRYHFLFASNGQQALDLIETQPNIHLFLCDIRMPVMDGISFIRKLYEQGLTTPTIMLTAYQQRENISSAMHYCAYDFITKPIDFNALQRSINNALRLQEQRKEHESLTWSIRDLHTARQQAELENQQKKTFFNTVHTQFHTSLHAIMGYSQLLQNMAVKDKQSDYPDNLSKISAAADHLLILMSYVMDTKSQHHSLRDLNIGQFPLSPFLKEIHHLVTLQAKQHHNTLTIPCDSALSLTTDALRLKQCLLNLLSNACKFTHQGHIELTLETQTPFLIFHIIDNGRGMSRKSQETLFQPFTQITPTVENYANSTGLGLYLSRQLAQRLGGDITLTSTLNMGSHFQLRIPLHYSPTTPTN